MAMPRVEIQPFQRFHLARVLEIEQASFPSDPYPRDLFLELAGDCPDWFFMAKAKGRLAGYILACVERGRGEIVSVAVHPRYRRQGVARALMRHIIRRMARRGISRLRLMVRPDNHAALRFYHGLGFMRVRKVAGYYEDGGDGIAMARDLTAPSNPRRR